MKTLAAYGCSHTNTAHGTPWPDFLAEKLGMNLYRRSSPGGNVGNHLDKLNVDLQNEDIDLIVLQLSQFFRLTLGFSFHDDYFDDDYQSGFNFRDVGYYTYSGNDDDKLMESNLNYKFPKGCTGITRFIAGEIVSSKWMRQFAQQQLYTFIALCKSFNKKLFIFSWDEPLTGKYVPKGGAPYVWEEWEHMLKGDNIGYINQSLNGYEGWFKEKGIEAIPNDGHYGTEAHKRFVDELLYSSISKFYI